MGKKEMWYKKRCLGNHCSWRGELQKSAILDVARCSSPSGGRTKKNASSVVMHCIAGAGSCLEQACSVPRKKIASPIIFANGASLSSYGLE